MSIKSAREAAGKTVREVAESMGVSRMAVYQWEAGVNNPSAKKLPALAQFLNASIDELMRKED